ncbi:MAG TPA: glycoside hydrolase family 19 protein [Urbifossiella sp.]|jgi:putative chitinase
MAAPGTTAAKSPSPTSKTTSVLTLDQLHKIMPHAPSRYVQPLNSAMLKYQITTPKRMAAFLAQLAEESNQLRHTHELWTGKKNFHLSGVKRAAHTATSKEDYFEHWYGKRKDLGNTTEEDGYTYRGRGAIQITGKANYIAVGKGIGQPLESNPDLLETDDKVDMLASAYFFARVKSLNHLADSVDPSKATSVSHVNRLLTHAVNGGHNGITERLKYYKNGLAALVK